jgi:ACS family glucarate transporter-like MFS transporter
VGCYSAGLRLGFAVTPVLMAYLLARWGWRSAFYATGLGSLAWVALWYFTYQENPAAPVAETTRLPVLALLRNRTVVGLVLCKFFQDYLFYLFVTWLPGYLVLSRGFSIIKMGWYASLPWVAGCLAQPMAGWISDSLIRRGVSVTVSRKSIIIAMQLLAASVILAGRVNDALTAVWLLTLSVACESAATSILWTTCADVSPGAEAGSLAGIMNSAGALAGILAPTVTGFLAKNSGSFQLPLLVGGIMVLLAAAAMLFIVEELRMIAVS